MSGREGGEDFGRQVEAPVAPDLGEQVGQHVPRRTRHARRRLGLQEALHAPTQVGHRPLFFQNIGDRQHDGHAGVECRRQRRPHIHDRRRALEICRPDAVEIVAHDQQSVSLAQRMPDAIRFGESEQSRRGRVRRALAPQRQIRSARQRGFIAALEMEHCDTACGLDYSLQQK